MRVKDPTSTQQKAGVVNRIPWGHCPKVYIDLQQHLTEHKRTQNSDEAVQSAVTKNAMEEAHTIKWEDAAWWTTICSITRDASFKLGTSGQSSTKWAEMKALFQYCTHPPVTLTHSLLIFYALPLHVSVWIHIPPNGPMCGTIVILFHFANRFYFIQSNLPSQLFVSIFTDEVPGLHRNVWNPLISSFLTSLVSLIVFNTHNIIVNTISCNMLKSYL